MKVEELVRRFGMAPHPEGGYYVQTYKSRGMIPAEALPEGWGIHAWSTAILFLLPEGACSRLHRIRQDEVWHFHLGGPMRLLVIYPDGCADTVLLGHDVLHGQSVQYAVPAGCWFGAAPCDGSAFSLVGCTVAPGFEFSDFELARREDLVRLYPGLEALITEFTE